MENSIIGKWYIYSTEKNGRIKIKKYMFGYKDYTEFKSNAELEIVFLNGKKDSKKEIFKGTYSLKGNTLKLAPNCCESVEYSCIIKNDEMIMVNNKGVKFISKRLK